MHQELDADGLALIRSKVHRLVNPRLAVARMMENGLKDVSMTGSLAGEGIGHRQRITTILDGDRRLSL